MTRAEYLKHFAGLFAANGFDDAPREARNVLIYALKLERIELITGADQQLTPEQEAAVNAFYVRRLQHETPSRITGSREFWGMEFMLSPDTLEPRPDSETLIETVLKLLPEAPASILDIGTGTGCLLLALLKEYPVATGTGTDMAEGALNTATLNAERLGMNVRAQFIRTNWAEDVADNFDVIISNPPYIRTDELAGLEDAVRLYDPRLALDGGADGLGPYRALVPQAYARLKTGGLLAVEIGQGQEADVADIFSANGFDGISSHRDLGGIIRVVAGWKS